MVIIVAILAVTTIGLLYVIWLCNELLRQNGRMLIRLEAMEKRSGEPQPAPAAPSLPLGSDAPAFDLPDLEGGRMSLADFHGKWVLAIFFNPRCGYCAQMAPDLAALPIDGAGGRPIPLVITTGSSGENRKLFAESGVKCRALLQEGMEVAGKYLANGTPMGYLIDKQGKIASAITIGAPELLALADGRRAAASAENGSGSSSGGSLQKHRGLEQSRIKRDGLSAGTAAPPFRLPRLDGGEISLEEYHGRKVLLVFSAPDCAPCNELAPKLNRAAKQTHNVDVLMVSRGDPEINRAKVKELRLTFPVALQKQWEISKLYAMFATPIAYLIDENGVIAEDVAVGEEAILALWVRAAIVGSNGADTTARLREEVVLMRK